MKSTKHNPVQKKGSAKFFEVVLSLNHVNLFVLCHQRVKELAILAPTFLNICILFITVSDIFDKSVYRVSSN